jgi:hypothetical protein
MNDRPTQVYLVERRPDYDESGAVMAGYYDEARAEAAAETLDRPIFDAEIAELRALIARTGADLDANPPSDEEAAYLAVAEIARLGKG